MRLIIAGIVALMSFTLTCCGSSSFSISVVGTSSGGGEREITESDYGWADAASARVDVGRATLTPDGRIEKAREFVGYTDSRGNLVIQFFNTTQIPASGLHIEFADDPQNRIGKAVSSDPLPVCRISTDKKSVHVSWDPEKHYLYRRERTADQDVTVGVYLRIEDSGGSPYKRLPVRLRAWWTVGVDNDMPVNR